MMFDTVKITTGDVGLNRQALLRAGWVETTSTAIDAASGELRSSQSLRLMRQGESPHFLQYSPEELTLTVETSLPKVLHGENISLLSPRDVPRALGELTNRVADLVKRPDLPDCASWKLRGRADAVFSWQAGKRIDDYLHAFGRLSLARHHTQNVDRDRTVYWKNGTRVIRLYDKQAETGDDAARGQLRFEVQPRRARAELGILRDTRAGDALTWHNARLVLSKYLEGLGGDLVITDNERLFKMLVSAHSFYRKKSGERVHSVARGISKATRLMGSVMVSKMYGRDELLAMGASKAKIYRDIADVKRAGANVATSKSGLLPPLTLPADDAYTGKPAPVGRVK